MASNEKYLKEINNYTKELEALAGKEVVVGIPASKNTTHTNEDGESITNAELGAIQEYGAPNANIPQRSFLRVPLQSNTNDIFKTIEKDLKFSKINTDKALGRLGAKGTSIVLEAFKTQGKGEWVELKPSTIRQRKGEGVKPLIDSGQLRQSITFEVRKNVT